MPTGRISLRSVDAMKPDAKDAYLWDSDLTGFALKVTPSGMKTYLVQFRVGAGRAGRTRRVTIGRHGAYTPEQARLAAKRVLGDVATGGDPAAARTEARRDLTVAELCDLYLDEGCATKKPGTVLNDRSRIDRHINPLLGRKRVRAIDRSDVKRALRDIANGKTACDEKTGPRGRAIVLGGKGVANRAIETLGAVFSFAVEARLRPDNPVKGVKKFQRGRHERFLSSAELARLGDALTGAETDGENTVAIAAIRLLVLSGARKSEILTLQWDHVDVERHCLRLPDSKTGAKTVPLGAPVLEVLAGLPRFEGNPYVLPGNKPGSHFVGMSKAWARIRERAGLGDVRLHDLRHSFASVAVAGGDSLYLVGKVLGHRQARTTEIYAHVHDDPLLAVADRTSRQIADTMNGASGGTGGEVVELPKRKA